MYADLILYNATIYTMDETQPTASKLAIKNGKIVAFDEEADQYGGPQTNMLDIKGKAILPGLVESHAHPLHYAANLLELDLRAEVTPTIDSILAAVRKKAEELPEGEWILGMGWDDSKLKEKRFPTIEELSAAAPNHPVFLKRTCVHNAVVNRKAFEKSGLSENPVDPDGGHFHKNHETGQLSGLIQENAMSEFTIPTLTIDQLKQAMMQAQQHFYEWGITTVHEMAVKKEEMIVYQQLQKEENFRLKVRLWLWAISQMGWNGIEDEVLALGIESGYGNDRLNIQGLKYMLDGSVGGRTAAVSEPYVNDGENRGILYMSHERLNEHIIRAVKNNLRVSIHGIGERAINMALEAIKQAGTPETNKLMRHRIEHCALATENHLTQLASHGIIAASSIGFIYSIGDSYLNNLGEERAERVFPHASFKKHGIKAPGNSDMPVCYGNPFFGIYAAVTRKTIGGQQLGTKEAIPVADAIKSYTVDAAYSGFDEQIIGSLSIGKYADLIVLDQDPFAIDAEKIKDVQVLLTMIEGETVFKRTREERYFYV
ncbi:amidohydrolase family protein [Bacillus aerolatus]|uniref:Amidohydrolase family protein n=1 Tax=Bacillus aerolatus TaxID=2653354 RepID=A0A6I1FFK1_9BACI|nr:amidohydrolase [Bacillus aerolatus]KAB7704059.1 amidohydrolase family protein [Bacillus aerolatus]